MDERRPLLGRPSATTSASSRLAPRLASHMNVNVSKHWADLVLLSCYIITGLLDSSAVSIWGSFVSMQTGNTVYLGLGLIAPNEGVRWIKALTSIASFCLGSFFFARFHRYFGSARRWVLVASYTLQLACIVLAALVVTLDPRTEGLHWQVLLPLGAVAFQSSGQAVTSRVLKYNGLTSVVLTSNYCDLFADAKIWRLSNIERNRRVAAPLLLLLGAMIGGLFAHSTIGMEGALWTAAGLKATAVVAWILWKPEQDGE
ncbi:hypothetical protein DM02DRAFT_615106 [Periconia macrospinosa]|uniref:DUF1275 domain protein n=1 Tax=Periconia macrospinosa TaxID=97972 RepID=A0A2V1DP50_9PLEO|nr:hypothetical protein DM02DRAFT_615106 [Periconia macrospinosa]